MRNRLILIGVQLGAFLMHARVAFARAGGGGGYSSGGSSSGGSSSSSSGGYSSSGGSGEASIFDLVLLFVILAFCLYARRQAARASKNALVRWQQHSESHAERLRERDPEFESKAFLARTSKAFHAIQQAWSEQNLESVRGFMSDGLHERFSIQIREQQALGYRNELSRVKIRECLLVDSEVHAHFDVVSVRISASASDARVDSESGREIKNSRRQERFTEIWSFLRGRDTHARSEIGLFEGQCPNCAAPIDPKRAWSCESCQSSLESAPPDWVLVEITQFSEWGQRQRDEPSWLKSAIERDPGLTEQQLEDRASVLFWRLMDAERMGDIGELKSVARPAFLDAQARRMDAAAGNYLGDCAVGAVSLRGILAGPEWDLALAEIRWSGGTYHRSASGAPKSTGSNSLRRSLLVMARRASATSSIGRCIVSAHCHRCGAPDEGAIEGGCQFCGEPLNDGSDWLIDHFLYMSDSEAVALLSELHDTLEGRPRIGRQGLISGHGESPAEGIAVDAATVRVAPMLPRGTELYRGA